MVLTSCGKSTPLTFESIAGTPFGHDLGGSYPGENAYVYVILNPLDRPLPGELNWVLTFERETILKVDYSKYLVVLAFNGFQYNIYSDFLIQKIVKQGNIVSIFAHFNDIPQASSTVSPAENSQYQAVKISRDQIKQTGLITFKLLDEKGKERARTTYELNSGG